VADPFALQGHTAASLGRVRVQMPAGGADVPQVGRQGLEVPLLVRVEGVGDFGPFDALVRDRTLGLEVGKIEGCLFCRRPG
jgi:hypothetical protein